MSERGAQLLLNDILHAAEKIINYTHGLSYEQFIHDEKTIDAVIRNFEIIGEAGNRLPEKIKDEFSSIDWFRIRGFRNRIVHDYMGINYKIVWNIKENYLPMLIDEIKTVMGNIG